jgi:replicative DNA helicase
MAHDLGVLPIPVDLHAEAAVAAAAAATARGARLAAERLAVGDFYHPALRRLFAAATGAGVAPALAVEDRAAPGDREDRRLDVLTQVAVVDRSWLSQLVAERPVMWDTAGSFAARVADAAHRRRVMTLAANLHAAAAVGAPVADLLVEVASVA